MSARKYSDEIIAEWRKLRASGVKFCEIEARFGLRPNTVHAVLIYHDGRRQGRERDRQGRKRDRAPPALPVVASDFIIAPTRAQLMAGR